LYVAFAAMCSLNLEWYDEVLELTGSTATHTHNPMKAVALILRAAALREKGEPAKARDVLINAARGCLPGPMMDLLNMGNGRAYAALGSSSVARSMFQSVQQSNPTILASVPDASAVRRGR
jgi:hypothetical protein